jgi:formylmethanofuran dehydrogenase subunit E
VDDALKFHGELAPGIILGFKMAMRALEEIEPSEEDSIVLTSETTRCIPDALQAVSRYLLVNGNYHVYTRTYDVGKLAIQVTKNHEDLFRLVLTDDYVQNNSALEAWAFLGKDKQVPAEEMRDVMWNIDIEAAFVKKSFVKRVKPEFKGKNVMPCPVCGESTSKLSMVEIDGQLICKTCAFFQSD